MTDVSSTPIRLEHEGDTLLTTRQAAGMITDRLIRVTEGTLRVSRSRGRLLGQSAPTWVRIGRSVRYRRSDLDAWLRAAAVECHAPIPSHV